MRWVLTDNEGTKVAWGRQGEPAYSMEFEVNDVEMWWTHDLEIHTCISLR